MGGYFLLFFIVTLIVSPRFSEASENEYIEYSNPLQPISSEGQPIETYCVVPLYAKSNGHVFGLP